MSLWLETLHTFKTLLVVSKNRFFTLKETLEKYQNHDPGRSGHELARSHGTVDARSFCKTTRNH